MTPSHPSTSSPVGPTDLQWWIRDRDGRVVVAQPPNAAIAVWLAATVGSWLAHGSRHEILSRVAEGALAVWALDEIVRGASPVRRLMGAVVLPIVLSRVL